MDIMRLPISLRHCTYVRNVTKQLLSSKTKNTVDFRNRRGSVTYTVYDYGIKEGWVDTLESIQLWSCMFSYIFYDILHGCLFSMIYSFSQILGL